MENMLCKEKDGELKAHKITNPAGMGWGVITYSHR